MTEDLRTLLRERADVPDLAPVDLLTVTRDGARAVRRRRLATVGAGVAAALVVGGLGAVGLQSRDGDQGFAVRQLGTDQVTWAIGSELHTPGDSVDLGHEIASYVRTGAGFVLTDPDGTVYSYAAGEVVQVGESGDGRLVGDPQSDWAGWVDSSGGSPQVVVLDVATGQVLRPDGANELYAVGAGDVGYWRTDQGVVGVDLSLDEVAVRVDGDAPVFDLLAASGTTYAVRRGRTLVVADGEDEGGVVGEVSAERASFSPDARHLSVDANDEMHVFDLEKDHRVPLTVPDAAVGMVEWLDDQQLVVVVRPRATLRYELMTCDVTTQACEAVDGTLTPGFQLPTGEHVDWH